MNNKPKHSRILPPLGAPSLRRLAVDEDGAAYSISYVMVIPFFAVLLCMIIECAIMFTAKLGTVYAGFAAARSASVWASATSWENATAKAQSAAVNSMAPLASGLHGGDEFATGNDGISFLDAYHAYSKEYVNDKYLKSKFGYAKQHTKVEIVGPPASSFDNITAKVTYEYPFDIPGIGRMLGKKGADGRYYYQIITTVTVPNEGPQDDRKTIGIGYGTLE